MTRLPLRIRVWFAVLPLALGLATPDLLALDRSFSTSPTLSTEARLLVRLLDEAQLNHAAVHNSDYAQAIPDYMTALDNLHLFFLGSDLDKFTAQYGRNYVFYNVAYLGNIDAAYQIYYTYQTRVEARINWLFDQLKKDNFDFTANDTFAPDRSKAEWPATQAGADDLWRRRLKFELLAEILNKKTLPEAREIVRKRYEHLLKGLADVDGDDVAEIYLSSITQLYDPHSDYMDADNFEDFGIQMKLQLTGIGAGLRMKDDYCTVEEIFPGSPADLGHQLKLGDKIISVAQDGAEPVEIVGMKLRKIVNMIRGQKGTRVHLMVQPALATDPSTRKEIIITRDVVKLNAARAHAGLFQVPDASGKLVPLGVISLPEFYGPGEDQVANDDRPSATQDIARLIGQLKQAGMKGLVLDLRHNGGGLLNEAVSLTGLFIHPGPVVQVRDGRGETRELSSKADKDGDQVDYSGPLAVLVDKMSASASEIVAGALQNYGRAIIVGDSSTHGKGTVQTLLEMKNFLPDLQDSSAKTGAAKITVQKFYLPNGSSTQLRGVIPDITMPTLDDYLPIGESSLPHALVWDRIQSTSFVGASLDPRIIASLRQESLARQDRLEEFSYLKKVVTWFKAREGEKLIPLNLQERLRQKKEDDAFKKEIMAERERLSKDDYAVTEFRVGQVPPKLKRSPGDDDGDDSDDDDSALNVNEDTSAFGKGDVHLRETLRILNDAIDLGQNHAHWDGDHAPLTIAINATPAQIDRARSSP